MKPSRTTWFLYSLIAVALGTAISIVAQDKQPSPPAGKDSAYVIQINLRKELGPMTSVKQLQDWLKANADNKYHLRVFENSQEQQPMENGDPMPNCPKDKDAGTRVSASHISQRAGFQSSENLQIFINALK